MREPKTQANVLGSSTKASSQAGRNGKVANAVQRARIFGRKSFLVVLSVALVLTLNPAAEYGAGFMTQALASPQAAQSAENATGGGVFT